jgi:hypothetical protein
MASTYSERLATGPLLRSDIDRVAAVLLRGLKRQSGGAARDGDEAGPMKVAPAAPADFAGSESEPSEGVDDAERSTMRDVGSPPRVLRSTSRQLRNARRTR